MECVMFKSAKYTFMREIFCRCIDAMTKEVALIGKDPAAN